MWKKLPSGRSEQNAVVVSNKEALAHLFFQPANPRADGGLGQIELGGRNRKAAMGGDFEKAAQIFRVQCNRPYRYFRWTLAKKIVFR
jgi:hypothetical protein